MPPTTHHPFPGSLCVPFNKLVLLTRHCAWLKEAKGKESSVKHGHRLAAEEEVPQKAKVCHLSRPSSINMTLRGEGIGGQQLQGSPSLWKRLLFSKSK